MADASMPPEVSCRRGHHSVIGAGETCYAVEKDDDVLLVFDKPLCLLDDDLGDLDVPCRGLVEGRAYDLALDGAHHVRHLLGPLVDEQDDEVYLLVVLRQAVGDGLEEHRLARSRGRDDEPALP